MDGNADPKRIDKNNVRDGIKELLNRLKTDPKFKEEAKKSIEQKLHKLFVSMYKT